MDTSHFGAEGHTGRIPATAQTVTAAVIAAVPVVRPSFESADKGSVVAAHTSVGVSVDSVEAVILVPNGPESSAMPH